MSLTPKERVSGTKRTLVAATLLALAGAGGCTTNPFRPTTRTVGIPQATAEPVVYNDEAMAYRQWVPSVSYYHSGATEAFPTRWPYEGQAVESTAADIVIDPVFFIVEVMTYPFRVLREPIGSKVVYAEVVLPPTYNAMPPLPPEPAPKGGPPPKSLMPFIGVHHWVTTSFDRVFGQDDTPPQEKPAPANNEPATTVPATSAPAETIPATTTVK